jgi:hypothetical protein
MFYCSALWQFFCIVTNNAKYFSPLLHTPSKNVPRCCLQYRSFFRFVATTRKSALISVHVCFSALLPTTLTNFLDCGPQHGKMIGVVASTVEKRSAMLATTYKNVQIRISPRIRNHMQTYTRVPIRAYAVVFH